MPSAPHRDGAPAGEIISLSDTAGINQQRIDKTALCGFHFRREQSLLCSLSSDAGDLGTHALIQLNDHRIFFLPACLHVILETGI